MNPRLSQFTAVIGIDWADTKHDICVQESDTDAREFSKILHKADKIHEWAQAMYQRYGGLNRPGFTFYQTTLTCTFLLWLQSSSIWLGTGLDLSTTQTR